MIFSFTKSHYMSKSKSCVSIDVRFDFCASFCVSNVKKLQKHCQKYTLAVPGKVLGIVSQDPSDSKFSWLHIDIFW